MVLDDPATLDKIIAEAIAAEKLERRDKEGENLIHAQNQQKPYTGWVKIMYDNRQIMSLAQYRDGQLDGQAASWDRSCQIGGRIVCKWVRFVALKKRKTG